MALNQVQARKCGCEYCKSCDSGQKSPKLFFDYDGSCGTIEDQRIDLLVGDVLSLWQETHCGVEIPEGVVCGPYWVDVTRTPEDLAQAIPPYTGAIGFLLYWDGTTWKADFYSQYIDEDDDPCVGTGWEYDETRDVPHVCRACGPVYTITTPDVPGCQKCSDVLCDDGSRSVDISVGDIYVGTVLAVPAGVYSFARGGVLPPGVGDGLLLGSCNYFYREFSFSRDPNCPDQYQDKIGVLVYVYGPDAFDACPETYEIEGSVDPGTCPPNIHDDDRASFTSYFCFDGDGNAVLSGSSNCCDYFPCGSNPTVNGITLGCNCPEGVPCDACEGFPIPLNLTAEIIGGSCEGGATELVWNGEAWVGEFNPFAQVILTCIGSAWSIGIDEGILCPGYLATAECDGLELVFDFSGCSLCEGGAFQVRITPAA